jgi:hypothetical protein
MYSLNKLKTDLKFHKADKILDESGLSIVYIMGNTVYMLTNDPCKKVLAKLHHKYPKNPYLPNIKKIGTTTWFYSRLIKRYLKTQKVNIYRMPFYHQVDRRTKDFKDVRQYTRPDGSLRYRNLQTIRNNKLRETVSLLEKEMAKKDCDLDSIHDNVLRNKKGNIILIDLFYPSAVEYLSEDEKFQSNLSAFDLFRKLEIVLANPELLKKDRDRQKKNILAKSRSKK